MEIASEEMSATESSEMVSVATGLSEMVLATASGKKVRVGGRDRWLSP